MKRIEGVNKSVGIVVRIEKVTNKNAYTVV